MSEPEYLTIQQVCEKLQVSRATVNRWIKRGLPTVKIGRLVRIKPEDLERFIAEQEQKDP